MPAWWTNMWLAITWALHAGNVDLGELAKRVSWGSTLSRALVWCCECHLVLSSKLFMHEVLADLIILKFGNLSWFVCKSLCYDHPGCVNLDSPLITYGSQQLEQNYFEKVVKQFCLHMKLSSECRWRVSHIWKHKILSLAWGNCNVISTLLGCLVILSLSAYTLDAVSKMWFSLTNRHKCTLLTAYSSDSTFQYINPAETFGDIVIDYS